MNRNLLLKLSFLISALCFSLGAAAQENTESTTETTTSTSSSAESLDNTPVEKAKGERVEKIEVTGSYIKRVDIEGPSPVVTIDKDDLEKSGYNSVADVLRNNAYILPGARESSGVSGAGAGAATAGIRAIGAGGVLVLLNGQRLPKVGGGNTVDLNLIPISAVERIEILKDGASALYGSDALGGVMNFITKKDYDGASIMTRYALPQAIGGDRRDIQASYGKTFNNGSFLTVFQYRNNKEVNDRDRDYSRITDLSTQGNDFGSPGTWSDDNGGFNFDPVNGCPAEQQNDRGSCSTDFTQFSNSLPAIEQYSLLLSSQYDINELTNVFFTGILNQRDVNWQFAPAPDFIQLPNAQATAPPFNLPATGDVSIRYRLVEELGPRASRVTTRSYGSQVGVKRYVGDTWEVQLTGSYGASNTYDLGHAGYANSQIINQLITNNQFNPFAPSGAKDDLSAADHDSEQWVDTTQGTIRTVANGELWGGNDSMGPLGMAIGGSVNWQDYRERVDAVTDAGNLFGGAGSAGYGRRDYQAIFTELGFYPLKDLETQLAVRYDNYNDFGDAINPKFAASWKASQKTLIRGSIGTGFRAPDLADLYEGDSFGFPTFIDQVACAQAGGTGPFCQSSQPGVVRSSGNENLEAEKSLSWNLGLVHQPNKEWDFTFDFWQVEVENQVGLNLSAMTLYELANGQQALQDNFGITVSRDANGVLDQQGIFAPNLNLGRTKAQGIDISVGNTAKVKAFGLPINVRTQMDHLQFIKFEQEEFPGTPIRSNRDNYFRNTLTVAFNTKPHTLLLASRTVSGGDKVANEAGVGTNGAGSLATYTEYDLLYEWDAGSWGKTSFQIKNVFNTDRPLDDTERLTVNYLNPSIYDPIGRLFILGYEYTF